MVCRRGGVARGDGFAPPSAIACERARVLHRVRTRTVGSHSRKSARQELAEKVRGEWWWWRSGFGAGADAGEAPAGAAALAQIWEASKDVMAYQKTFGIPQ